MLRDPTSLQTIFILVETIVPAVLLVWCFTEIDFFPEPRRVIWTTFLLGIASVPLLEVVWYLLYAVNRPFALTARLSESAPTATTWLALLGSVAFFALTEELLKFGVFRFYSARSTHFNEAMDGLVYGGCAGLGFGMWENIGYAVFGTGWSAFIRAFLTAPNHGLWGAFIGYYVGKAVLARRGALGWSILAVGTTTVVHTAWNYALFARRVLETHHLAPGWIEVIQYSPYLLQLGMWYWLGRTLTRERNQQLARHAAGETRAQPPPLFARRRLLAGSILTVLGLLLAAGSVTAGAALLGRFAELGMPTKPLRVIIPTAIGLAPIALAGLLFLHAAVRRFRGGPI